MRADCPRPAAFGAGCLKNVVVVWGGILQGDVVTARELEVGGTGTPVDVCAGCHCIPPPCGLLAAVPRPAPRTAGLCHLAGRIRAVLCCTHAAPRGRWPLGRQRSGTASAQEAAVTAACCPVASCYDAVSLTVYALLLRLF